MNKLSLDLPGFPGIANTPGLDAKFPIKQPFLGPFLSGLLNVVIFLAVFLAFYYLVWGAFQYIMARGNKEELGKARARITWAIVGLFITLLSFIIATYAGEIFKPTSGGLPF